MIITASTDLRGLSDIELRSVRADAVHAANSAANDDAAAPHVAVIERVDAEFRSRDDAANFDAAYAASGFKHPSDASARPDVATERRNLAKFIERARVGESIEVETRSVLAAYDTDARGAATIPTTPGPLVDPAVWVGGLEPLARTFRTVSGEPMPVPVVASRPAFAAVSEGGTIPESNGTLATVTLTPVKFAAISGATVEMIQDSALDAVNQLIVPGFNASWKLTAEDALLNGTNVTGDGILGETAGVTTAATNAVTGDELIEAFHALPTPYRAGAVWVFSPATFEAVRKLKASGSDEYLVSGISEGTPRIMGRPVLECPQAADMGAGNTFGAIVDVHEAVTQRYVRRMTVERSDDWKFDEDIVSFKARMRYDAAVVNSDAVVAIANKA